MYIYIYIHIYSHLRFLSSISLPHCVFLQLSTNITLYKMWTSVVVALIWGIVAVERHLADVTSNAIDRDRLRRRIHRSSGTTQRSTTIVRNRACGFVRIRRRLVRLYSNVICSNNVSSNDTVLFRNFAVTCIVTFCVIVNYLSTHLAHFTRYLSSLLAESQEGGWIATTGIAGSEGMLGTPYQCQADGGARVGERRWL